MLAARSAAWSGSQPASSVAPLSRARSAASSTSCGVTPRKLASTSVTVASSQAVCVSAWRSAWAGGQLGALGVEDPVDELLGGGRGGSRMLDGDLGVGQRLGERLQPLAELGHVVQRRAELGDLLARDGEVRVLGQVAADVAQDPQRVVVQPLGALQQIRDLDQRPRIVTVPLRAVALGEVSHGRAAFGHALGSSRRAGDAPGPGRLGGLGMGPGDVLRAPLRVGPHVGERAARGERPRVAGGTAGTERWDAAWKRW
jgi:hypothetical protein